MKKLGIIGYASGAGASDDRCKLAASFLKEAHIEHTLTDLGLEAKWLPLFELPDSHPTTPAQKLEHTRRYCQAIAEQNAALIEEEALPLVFGGDHSMAMGTWSGISTALDAQEELGLIWIDAHLDAHTPTTTTTGNYHGMPLAALLGYGEPVLTHILSDSPKLNPKHLVMIGIRSYEEGEHALLTSLGVKIFYMDEVTRRGFATVFEEALAIVATAKKGFGITFDIDAFDPSVAPGTGTKEKDGLPRDEVLRAMQGIGRNPSLKGLEITEFNPILDKDGRTFLLIKQMLQSFFAKEA